MGNKTILIIGSLNIDLVAMTKNLPQPGETVSGSNFYTFPGGKGANQAVAAAKLGANVYMAGCVGEDNFGSELLASLEQNNVDIKYVERVTEPTGTALITVDSLGANTIVVIPGANNHCVRKHIDKVLSEIEEPGILLVQNELLEDTVQYAIKFAKGRGWMVIYNPAPARAVSAAMLSMVDIIIPNETEAASMLGRCISCAKDAAAAAQAFISAGAQVAIITLGSKGVVCSSKTETWHIDAIKVNAVDTTAAGDAFTGALAVALSEGQSIQSSLHFANAAAALAVTRIGAQLSLGRRDEVEAFIAMQQIKEG